MKSLKFQKGYIRTVVKDENGNWVPPAKPKIVYDVEAGKFKYEGKPVDYRPRYAIGLAPLAWWEEPWFLNLPIDEQIAFVKREVDSQIKSAKKSNFFDKIFSGFLNVFFKFIPFGGIWNAAAQRGLKHELESRMDDIKRQAGVLKEGLLTAVKQKHDARHQTQQQIFTRSRSTLSARRR